MQTRTVKERKITMKCRVLQTALARAPVALGMAAIAATVLLVAAAPALADKPGTFNNL